MHSPVPFYYYRFHIVPQLVKRLLKWNYGIRGPKNLLDVEMYPMCQVTQETIAKARAKRLGTVGFPVMFALRDTDRMDFFPAADRDGEINLTYFPQRKIA